jgi:hypothetical protein
MKEIDISTIMKQLGFSPSQVERWQQIQLKSLSQSSEVAGAQIVNLPSSLIHSVSFIRPSESIVI